MGVAETFSVLPALPDRDVLLMLDRALGEPHPDLQRRAVEFILADRKPDRLATLVAHFPDLVPEVRRLTHEHRAQLIVAAEDIIKRVDPVLRASAYQLIAERGDLSHAAVLLPGLEDHSARVRHTTESALNKMMEQFYTHLLQAKKNRERVSQELVTLFKPHALTVVQTMLQLYDSYPHPLYVRTAIEMGESAYLLFMEPVLERPGSALYKAFITSMSMAHSPEATELLIRLCAERSPRARDAAAEICRRRSDPTFGNEVAAHFARLDPEALKVLSSQMTIAPWWDASMQSADLSTEELRLLAETLRATQLKLEDKQDRFRALLKHPVGRFRAVGYEQLNRMEFAQLASLAEEGLRDGDPEVVLTAAQILVDRGTPDLSVRMAPFVKSPHPGLAKLALQVVADESFTRYLTAFDRLDEATRERAAQAISKIDRDMIDHLRDEIESLDSARRLKALRIVEYANKEDELRPLLMDLLFDPDVKVRSTAIKIVQLSGSAEGMRLLIDALNDSDRRVRANAVEAFENIGDTRYVGLLQPFLQDPDNRVRGNAARALYRLGVLEARQTLVEMLESPDRLMRLSATWIMHDLGAEEFRPHLAERLGVEDDPQIQKRIREALSETRIFKTLEESP